MRFRTVVDPNGRTATGFRVPDDVVAALRHGRKPPVRVTIGGHSYRSTVAVYGGVYMLPLSAENRTAAGVAAGDDIDVDVELDTDPRVVEVPADLGAALDRSAAARRAFDALSYSRQRQHVLAVTGARTDATRVRRIEKIVAALAGATG